MLLAKSPFQLYAVTRRKAQSQVRRAEHHTHVTHVGKRRRDAQGVSHALDVGRLDRIVYMAMEKEIESESLSSTVEHRDMTANKVIRELSKLSRETQFLSNRNFEIRESLTKLRGMSDLSAEDMRAAIDEILNQVISVADSIDVS